MLAGIKKLVSAYVHHLHQVYYDDIEAGFQRNIIFILGQYAY